MVGADDYAQLAAYLEARQSTGIPLPHPVTARRRCRHAGDQRRLARPRFRAVQSGPSGRSAALASGTQARCGSGSEYSSSSSSSIARHHDA